MTNLPEGFDPNSLIDEVNSRFDALENDLFGEVQAAPEPIENDEPPLDPETVFDLHRVLEDYAAGKLDGEALQAVAEHETNRRAAMPHERTLAALRADWDKADQEKLLASPEYAAFTESNKGL